MRSKAVFEGLMYNARSIYNKFKMDWVATNNVLQPDIPSSSINLVRQHWNPPSDNFLKLINPMGVGKKLIKQVEEE